MVEELLKKIEELKAVNQQLADHNMALVGENRALKHRLDALLRRIYGRRSEKINPDQLLLFAVEEMEKNAGEPEPKKPADSTPDDEEPPRRRRPRRNTGRKPLPEDIPRHEIIHDLPAEDRICPCCHEPMQKIGQDVSEQLEYFPACLVVLKNVLPKYACKKCQEGVIRTALPPKPIEKGRPGPGLLAHLLVSKYNDHLPLHRQEAIFARLGVDLPRSTLCDWVGEMAKLLQPIVGEMKRKVLESPVLQSDDTPIRVQDPELPGKTRRSTLWAYADPDGEVVFEFTKTRSGQGPARFLAGYRGTLQVDGYAGYGEVFHSGLVTQAGCWAHARRKYYEARDEDPALAATVLAAIQKLYAVERQAKEEGLSAEARCDLRQREAAPIIEHLKEILVGAKVSVLPRSALGEAIAYTLNQWRALVRYLEDGRVEIDNNSIERCIRGVAIGRKNWIFAGSKAGGERAAVIYSLIETCKRLKIDRFAFLRDVIDRVSAGRYETLWDLTPRGWKDRLESPSQPADGGQ